MLNPTAQCFSFRMSLKQYTFIRLTPLTIQRTLEKPTSQQKQTSELFYCGHRDTLNVVFPLKHFQQPTISAPPVVLWWFSHCGTTEIQKNRLARWINIDRMKFSSHDVAFTSTFYFHLLIQSFFFFFLYYFKKHFMSQHLVQRFLT